MLGTRPNPTGETCTALGSLGVSRVDPECRQRNGLGADFQVLGREIDPEKKSGRTSLRRSPGLPGGLSSVARWLSPDLNGLGTTMIVEGFPIAVCRFSANDYKLVGKRAIRC
jgi:hypothetical protein